MSCPAAAGCHATYKRSVSGAVAPGHGAAKVWLLLAGQEMEVCWLPGLYVWIGLEAAGGLVWLKQVKSVVMFCVAGAVV